jgi:hypothetical protein
MLATEPRIGRPERRGAERLLLGQLEDVVVGRVGGLGDLLGDHALLAFEFGGVEHGAEHEIAGDLRRERQPALKRAHLEAGPLMAGRGVDGPAGVLDRFGQPARVPAPRAP